MKAKEILKPTVALFLICLIATVLLALTNDRTAQRIEEISAAAENTARAALFPEADDFRDCGEIDGTPCFAAVNAAGDVLGYTFTTSAKGYGGDVRVMTGVLADGSVGCIEILDVSDETPGLGQNAKKDAFKAQFNGMRGEIGVSTASKSAANSIDALTGATYTSNGVTNAVNQALALFAKIPQGGDGNG